MLKVTEAASQKLQSILAEQGDCAIGLRVHILPGGCSGYSYGMSLAGTTEAGDWVGEFNGVKVLVDPDSAPFLEGASIDYLETIQASGFTITNPNAARSCGCGKSFDTEAGAEAETHEHAHGGGCGCGSGGCGCGGH
jgi:iron-sulfur cluster assembly protein